MSANERGLYWVQALAVLALSGAYFLPLYETYGLVGRVHQAEAGWLFFWPGPVVLLSLIFSNRWLRLISCLLASCGGLLSLGLFHFLANFKATPRGGFFLAQFALGVLILGWLSLGLLALTKKTSQPAPTEPHPNFGS